MVVPQGRGASARRAHVAERPGKSLRRFHISIPAKGVDQLERMETGTFCKRLGLLMKETAPGCEATRIAPPTRRPCKQPQERKLLRVGFPTICMHFFECKAVCLAQNFDMDQIRINNIRGREVWRLPLFVSTKAMAAVQE
jgi:hypothetical protein